MSNNETMFKGYLRSIMRQLKRLKTAIESDDSIQSRQLIDELLEDAQNTIDD